MGSKEVGSCVRPSSNKEKSSTHWVELLAEATGFEPAISALTGPHVRPLHHASSISCTPSYHTPTHDVKLIAAASAYSSFVIRRAQTENPDDPCGPSEFLFLRLYGRTRKCEVTAV